MSGAGWRARRVCVSAGASCSHSRESYLSRTIWFPVTTLVTSSAVLVSSHRCQPQIAGSGVEESAGLVKTTVASK